VPCGSQPETSSKKRPGRAGDPDLQKPSCLPPRGHENVSTGRDRRVVPASPQTLGRLGRCLAARGPRPANSLMSSPPGTRDCFNRPGSPGRPGKLCSLVSLGAGGPGIPTCKSPRAFPPGDTRTFRQAGIAGSPSPARRLYHPNPNPPFRVTKPPNDTRRWNAAQPVVIKIRETASQDNPTYDKLSVYWSNQHALFRLREPSRRTRPVTRHSLRRESAHQPCACSPGQARESDRSVACDSDCGPLCTAIKTDVAEIVVRLALIPEASADHEPCTRADSEAQSQPTNSTAQDGRAARCTGARER
jgi:hypothetical protein